jgi:elongation factor Ts
MKLRNMTGAQMMACKQALTEANGDMQKAVENLRKRFKDVSAKAAERETAEGRVGIFIDPAQQVGAIIEVRCETAPVAKNERFVQLVNDLAKQVALKGATTPEELLKQPALDDPQHTVQDRITDLVGLMRENMKPVRLARLTGHLGGYVHHDGTVGVLFECKGDKANDELLRDVSAHIAALNPPYTTTADVPADIMAKEKDLVMADIQADPKNASKPANIVEKIAEGKLKTKLAEIVLTEQPMANVGKYPNTTVGAALQKAGLTPVKFVRLKVGAVTL